MADRFFGMARHYVGIEGHAMAFAGQGRSRWNQYPPAVSSWHAADETWKAGDVENGDLPTLPVSVMRARSLGTGWNARVDVPFAVERWSYADRGGGAGG